MLGPALQSAMPVRVICQAALSKPVYLPVLAIAFGVIASAAPAGAPGPPVSGGTSAERRALGSALASLHIRTTRVEIAPGPGHGYPGHRITLTFVGPSDALSQWKDEVATGVYLVQGFPARWITIPGLGSGHDVLRRGMRTISATRVRHALKLAARRAHVRIDRIQLLKPLLLAPMVTITVRDPHAFARRSGLRLLSLLGGSHPRLEGIFLIVRDRHGHVISRGGTAVRVGSGAGSWLGSDHG
jgi:hypothetical protein